VSITRLFSACLAIWLLTAWTLPVCCLSIGAHQPSAVGDAMPASHHHHPGMANGVHDMTRSHQRSVAASCGEMCASTASMPALLTEDRAVTSGLTILPLPSGAHRLQSLINLRSEICILQSAPPGDRASGSSTLRI
jgi:hypothetical protein